MISAVSEPVLAALLLGKAAQANERGVELVVSEDSGIDDGLLPASLTPRDLVTVLGNLIDNAMDAAQGTAGARVTVTAFTEMSALVLRVADTGAGVDPAHAEQVFRRGWSTKPAGPGGRGLGLALARQTVSRHAGTLNVREGTDGGAEFEVRLPLPATPAAPAPPQTQTPDDTPALGPDPAPPRHTGPTPARTPDADPTPDRAQDPGPTPARTPGTGPGSVPHACPARRTRSEALPSEALSSETVPPGGGA